MQITRGADACPYETRGHHDVVALRLQGPPATDAETVTVGLSHFLPGGGAARSSSPLERVYVVLEGEMSVVTDALEATLGPGDSCVIPAGEERELENRANRPASMLVVMPAAPGG